MTKNLNDSPTGTPIAIVGMGCLFPKARDLASYWRFIRSGGDGITDVPETHWPVDAYFDGDPKRPDMTYCRRGGFLSPTEFDPIDFGIPPTSIEATDTAQLLGLSVAKQAMEDAGYGEDRSFDRERAGVILGVTGTLELALSLGARLGHPIWRKALREAGVAPDVAEDVVARIADGYVPWQENSFPGLLGNVVAGRIANRLNLRGTNCVVDAACASSLSAIHLSMLELADGRADLVLTGGVDTLNDIFMFMCFSKTPALSPTGDARPFSSDADGTVIGEGLGMVVLRRLEDAIRDRERIYAVIRSVGTSSDGRSQSIYAPHSGGQARALWNAYRLAGVDPSTVELIEAHGTGTKVGDAVEFEALETVFRENRSGESWCGLGSVKSQIGHTKAAAGAAGLIKATLAVHHRTLPPTIKVAKPNAKLGLNSSPFYLNTELRPWFTRGNHPRRAGISSFGFGGSNFHLVIEEHCDAQAVPAWDGSVELVALSSRSIGELRSALRHWKTIASDTTADPHRLARAAAASRREFSASDPHRLVMVIESEDELERLIAQLGTRFDRLSVSGEASFAIQGAWYDKGAAPGKLAFLFPGQGSQYPNMGRDLACTFPEFAAAFAVADHFDDSDRRLTQTVFPKPVFDDAARAKQSAALTCTNVAQPAIGATCLGMLAVLDRFGVRADCVAGHSYGELVALHAAGRIDAESLRGLSRLRGQLMANGDGGRGTMLAVHAPLDELDALAKEVGLVLANRNAPRQGVLSGPRDAVDRAATICEQRGYRTTRLSVAGAFHSESMNSARDPFAAALESTTFIAGTIPVCSNVTSRPYPAESGSVRKLLADQLIRPVDFVQVVENLYSSGVTTFLEIGPGAVLTGLVGSILKGRSHAAFALDASGGRRSGMADLARSLAQLAARGHTVDLTKWERPVPESKKPRMTIPLVGANYRSPDAKRADPEEPPQVVRNSENQAMAEEIRQTTPATNNVQPREVAPSRSHEPTIPERVAGEPAPIRASGALGVVQDGIRAMQALQRQTAAVHERFLEGQELAHKTILRLLEGQAQTPRVTQDAVVAPIAPMPDPAPAPSAPVPTVEARQESAKEQIVAAPVPAVETIEAETRPDTAAFDSLVLEVVSDKTGYPVEMLDLDMDIEADLGIDSIKRVEIVATIEERSPGLSGIQPEHMGSLRTLREIIAYMTSTGSAVSVANETTAEPATAKTGGAELEELLLSVVSELTGYPSDMLDLDMDIEADLGIDSIKRVEILAAVEARAPSFKAVNPEHLGGLRTLRQIVEYGGAGADAPAPSEATVPRCDAACSPSKSTRVCEPPENAGFESGNQVQRCVLRCVNLPEVDESPVEIAPGTEIWVTDDETDLAPAIVRTLQSRGCEARVVPISAPADSTRLGGIVCLAPVVEAIQPCWDERTDRFIEHALQLAGKSARPLIEAATKGGALFATVSRMDGAFGLVGGTADPTVGGLAGLAKTASHEWPGVLCRALDVSATWTNADAIAATIVRQLTVESPMEVGLDRLARRGLELTEGGMRDAKLPLREGDVVVVTGGARGVTAAAAMALAKRIKPTLVLLGRTPGPTDEPEWLAGLTDEAQIKRRILSRQYAASERPNPAQLESAFRRHMTNREVLENLRRLEATGVRVVYQSVDVRQPAAVRAVLGEVRANVGPIRGIIHAAGVLEDRSIESKSVEQFRSVWETKVGGLRSLLDATGRDDLKLICLFSSVSARFGNAGQADYAMANEVLNKTAHRLAASRPDCRVVSINWGPWDGGMVGPELKRVFEKRGVNLIPIEAGAESMVDEICCSDRGAVEVVIGSGFDDEHRPETTPATVRQAINESLTVTFERELAQDRHAFLKSHVLRGRPVLPVAMSMEWMAHAALHANPGLRFHGFDGFRLFKGVVVGDRVPVVRLAAGRVRRSDSVFCVDVELRGSDAAGRELLHAAATVVLADATPATPNFETPSDWDLQPYAGGVERAYSEVLFHGPHFEGIKSIKGICDRGVIARGHAARPPAAWMHDPIRSDWLCDPLLIDSAFQSAILWCHRHTGAVSLPSKLESYRQYVSAFPRDGVGIVLEVTDHTAYRMRCNVTYVGGNGAVVARMGEYECAMDASLNSAFRSAAAVVARA